MSRLKFALVLVFLIVTNHQIKAQDSYRLGVRPNLTIQTPIKNDWSIITEYEAINQLKKGYFKSDKLPGTQNILEMEFSLLAQKKLNKNSSFTTGYIYSQIESIMVHEIMQEFTTSQKLNGIQLKHRFRVDETFGEGVPLRTRLRYRLNPVVPLEGDSIEKQEFFLNLQTEYIYFVRKGNNPLEFRVVPMLGYKLNDKNKVDFGIDGRVYDLLGTDQTYIYWGRLNWTLNF